MRRRREVVGWFTLALIIAWPMVLWGTDRELQEPKAPIARLEVQPARVDWLPQGDYERLVLTVAGPEGFYIQRDFDSGETPSFSSLDAEAGRLPDGSYAYELREVPRLDPELREKLAEARETGNDSAVNELRKGGRLPEGPLVQSGHLWVQGGSFMDKVPVPRDPSNPGESASRPPLRNFTAKTTINDDLIVKAQACIGSGCVDGDADGPVLKFKEPFGGLLQIKFDSTDCCHPSTADWALQANDASDPNGPNGDFMIRTNSTIPFRIAPNAPDNALNIFPNGYVGLGTLTPAVHLDVKASDTGKAAARLQNSSATGYSGIEYLDNAGNVDLFFGIDNAASSTRLNSINNNPIIILTNSTERARITSGGDVGIGTASPAAALDVTRSTGAVATLARFSNNKGIQVLYDRTDSGALDWQTSNFSSTFEISVPGSSTAQFSLQGDGDLTISGTLTELSSREAKTDFESLNPMAVLERVTELPISVWSYKQDTARHIGPMAEDFYEAFGLGDNNKTIAPGDKAGVALAAIKGLHQIIAEKEADIAMLHRENAGLLGRLEALEALIARLIEEEEPTSQAEPARESNKKTNR